MKKRLNIGFLVFLILAVLPLPPAAAVTHIMNVRHWAAPDYSRVVFDTSEEAKYTVSKEGKKITIDFESAIVDEEVPLQSFLNKPGIEKIIVMALPGDAAKVEIYLLDNVETKIFKLKKFQDKPDRIVVDIELPDVEKKESEDRLQLRAAKKDKIIVIDPGHGGEDPGAIGKKGTREKDVVLKISRKLKDTLSQRPGYRSFLTRNGDYYVPFKKRLKIAREYGADLFISVHADAVRDRRVRGGSVYALSTRGASSEAARLLASRENLADVIGGSENDDTIDAADHITLDMVQTNTFNLSRSFGSVVLANIKDVNALHFKTVQAAPFKVLKLPDVPSVLVETAYISHPVEEQLLVTPAFQQEVADAIAASVYAFVPATYVPSAPVPVQVTRKEEAPRASKTAEATATPAPAYGTYVVKKGDTLEKIAIRHRTTVGELTKINAIKRGDSITIGRKLKVPIEPAEGEEASAPVLTTYTVRKGDTFDRIAKKHHMSVAALLILNDMQPQDPLYVNRKLKVYAVGRDNDRKEPPAAAKRNLVMYTVRKGDSLERIATKHHMSVAELQKVNGMKPRDGLTVNQKIKVYAEENGSDKKKRQASRTPPPANKQPTTYVVKRGDTLDKIARKHNTTVAALIKLNKLKPNDPLYVNRKLKLPAEEDI
jgi:N-acetylmuramoyl-L-alanine amidase